MKQVALILGADGGYSRGILLGVAAYLQGRQAWRTYHAAQGQEALLGELLKLPLDGVIAADASASDVARRVSCPLISLAPGSEHHCPTVICDNREIGRLAEEFLFNLGLRDLGYLHEPLARITSTERWEGFVAAHAARGLTPVRLDLASVWMLDLREAVIERLREWLTSLPRPAGVFAFNDQWASLALEAAAEARRRVPEDLAVLGCDDHEVVCQLSHPPLSSIDNHPERIGHLAAERLDDLMEGRTDLAAVLKQGVVRVPPRGVIERASTDVLALDDPDVVQAIRYLRRHYDQPLTIGDVAEHVAVSRRGLELKFTRLLGRSPSQELWRLRTQHGLRLLRDTDFGLARIALASGFKTVPHLSARIKTFTGQTPTDYRRTHRRAT